MSGDEQDAVEGFDDDALGREAVTSDEASVSIPPDEPIGLPFADADVTDESFAERSAREEPEVWERTGKDGADLLQTPLDEDGDLAEGDEVGSADELLHILDD